MRATIFHRNLLFLAGLLLSLHSVVPHVHGARGGNSEAITAQDLSAPNGDLLSLLQDIFTNTDLGEDHLEHFSADHDVSLGLVMTAALPPTAGPVMVFAPRTVPAVMRRQRVFRSRHFPPSGVYPDTAAPRGPPSLV